MYHKVLIETPYAVYDGETHEKEENQMTIWNYQPLLGTTGLTDGRIYILRLDEVRRVYRFELTEPDLKLELKLEPRPVNVPYSLVITEPDFTQRIRTTRLSFGEYQNIIDRLAAQKLNQPMNMSCIRQLAVHYDVTDGELKKISIDNGFEIVSYVGSGIDMTFIKRIFEDDSLNKIVYNSQALKSGLKNVKFVNVFDVLMVHRLNMSRQGEYPRDVSVVELCQELLELPALFFVPSNVVAFLFSVFYRQEPFLNETDQEDAEDLETSESEDDSDYSTGVVVATGTISAVGAPAAA